MNNPGGERGIRTPEELAPLTVFKTAAFDRSAISPFLTLKKYTKIITLKQAPFSTS
jgi:hypothetical protein